MASLFGFELNQLDEETFLETVGGIRVVGNSLIDTILTVCPMAKTDRALREMIFRAFELEKPHRFDSVRKTYRLRRESEPSPL